MNTSKKSTIHNSRTRPGKHSLVRFAVLGRDSDRNLIRSLARRLAENTPEAIQLRAAINQVIASEAPKKGGILAALLRSPLADANVDFTRSREEGREVKS